jgi:OOP family OmpA-OmpF porin
VEPEPEPKPVPAPEPIPEPVPEPKPVPPPKPAPVERTIILDDVLFDFDRSTVKPEAGAILDRLIAFMNENKDKKVNLSGYTDNIGTEAYNQKLSERRVASVRDYVVKKGVDGGRVSGQGFGESKPIADNKTAAGRAKNRRVEIKVN